MKPPSGKFPDGVPSHLLPGRPVRIIAGHHAGAVGRLVRHLEYCGRARVELLHDGQCVQVDIDARQVEAAFGELGPEHVVEVPR